MRECWDFDAWQFYERREIENLYETRKFVEKQFGKLGRAQESLKNVHKFKEKRINILITREFCNFIKKRNKIANFSVS